MKYENNYFKAGYIIFALLCFCGVILSIAGIVLKEKCNLDIGEGIDCNYLLVLGCFFSCHSLFPLLTIKRLYKENEEESKKRTIGLVIFLSYIVLLAKDIIFWKILFGEVKQASFLIIAIAYAITTIGNFACFGIWLVVIKHYKDTLFIYCACLLQVFLGELVWPCFLLMCAFTFLSGFISPSSSNYSKDSHLEIDRSVRSIQDQAIEQLRISGDIALFYAEGSWKTINPWGSVTTISHWDIEESYNETRVKINNKTYCFVGYLNKDKIYTLYE